MEAVKISSKKKQEETVEVSSTEERRKKKKQPGRIRSLYIVEFWHRKA